MARIRDNASARIDVRRIDSSVAESFLHQPAGEPFPETEKMVSRFEIELADRCQIVQQGFQSAELITQFAIQNTVSGSVDERIRQPLMPHVDRANGGESRAQVSARRGISRLEQLISHSRKGADYHHRLRAQPALHDADDASDGGSILHRRASEFHHHHFVARLKSALSLYLAHRSISVSRFCRKRKTHRQIALAVGSGELCLGVLYFIRSRPPEDT